MAGKVELFVVVPVFNEEASIARVIDEWVAELRRLQIQFRILILDDGSRDSTPSVIKSISDKFPNELAIESHPNVGHGQTCVLGYKLALQDGADWIFQIDSDGQCDPKYFSEFWRSKALISQSSDGGAAADVGPMALFGFRRTRDDGVTRIWVSKIVRLAVWLATGTYVRDPNVPYRLIHRSILQQIVSRVPRDVYLANILVSVLVERETKVSWLPIGFRERFGGSPSLKFSGLVKRGLELIFQLRRSI